MATEDTKARLELQARSVLSWHITKFNVEKAIFAKWPKVRIGAVVVLGMDNTKGKEESWLIKAA